MTDFSPRREADPEPTPEEPVEVEASLPEVEDLSPDVPDPLPDVAGEGPAREAIARAHRRALAVMGAGAGAWPEEAAIPGVVADVIGEVAPQLADRDAVVRMRRAARGSFCCSPRAAATPPSPR